MPLKTWKNHPKKLLIIRPDPFFMYWPGCLNGPPPSGLVTPGSTGTVLVPKQSKVKNVFLATQVANVITNYSVGGPFPAMCLNFLRGSFKIAEYLQILKTDYRFLVPTLYRQAGQKNIKNQAELSKKSSSSALLRCITNGFTYTNFYLT